MAQRRVVVGVDGSESSKAALTWAVRQAKLTGAVVEAVIAWKLPATFGLVPLPYMGSLGATRKILADSIAETGNAAADMAD
jgi:nucleotide-binding universal stress UspA family protein